MKTNSEYYKNIHIPEANLDAYPADGRMVDIIPCVNLNDDIYDNVYENTLYQSFVPLIGSSDPAQVTIQQLRLYYPSLSIDPMNEFNTKGLVARAFPALFPFGNAELNQVHLSKINSAAYF